MQSACFFLWIAISLQSRPSPRFRFLIDVFVSRAFLMSFDYALLRERSGSPVLDTTAQPGREPAMSQIKTSALRSPFFVE